MTGILLAALLASPQASPEATARARELTTLSIREYNLGKYDAALKAIEEAYELTGLPALLFNLGQCHRAMRHWERAEFFYRGYLRENPHARNRAEAEKLLAEMHEKMAQAAPAAPIVEPAPPPAAPPETPVVAQAPALAPAATAEPAPATAISEEPHEGRHLSGTTWWLGGGGAVALVAGTVLGVLAHGNDGSTPGPNGVVEHSVPVGSYVAGQYEGLSADVLWAVGGGLVVAAAVVALTSH